MYNRRRGSIRVSGVRRGARRRYGFGRPEHILGEEFLPREHWNLVVAVSFFPRIATADGIPGLRWRREASTLTRGRSPAQQGAGSPREPLGGHVMAVSSSATSLSTPKRATHTTLDRFGRTGVLSKRGRNWFCVLFPDTPPSDGGTGAVSGRARWDAWRMRRCFWRSASNYRCWSRAG